MRPITFVPPDLPVGIGFNPSNINTAENLEFADREPSNLDLPPSRSGLAYRKTPSSPSDTSSSTATSAFSDPNLPRLIRGLDKQPRTIWQKALAEGVYLRDTFYLLSGISNRRPQLYRRYRTWGFRRREALLAARGLKSFRYCHKCMQKHWISKCKSKPNPEPEFSQDPADELGNFGESEGGDPSGAEDLDTRVEGQEPPKRSKSKFWK
ncbi:hypothetical protein TWF506_000991 [Arthrobotrys conoides]|uniref:Uncharacterized protein n=1 Tax=Arthrobotrys conoides TaxID=74498 RepID=A0AAN8NSD0_9PEZI